MGLLDDLRAKLDGTAPLSQDITLDSEDVGPRFRFPEHERHEPSGRALTFCLNEPSEITAAIQGTRPAQYWRLYESGHEEYYEVQSPAQNAYIADLAAQAREANQNRSRQTERDTQGVMIDFIMPITVYMNLWKMWQAVGYQEDTWARWKTKMVNQMEGLAQWRCREKIPMPKN